MIKKGVRHMINYTRIKWMYDNLGLASAIRSATIDIATLLLYIGYCLTMPFLFFWLLYRRVRDGRL